jgi:hypothetical protein
MEEVQPEEESPYDRYSRMSRPQKLALLMISLGPDASATLLKRFDAKDAENICKEIGNFPIIDQEIKDCVLDEFSEIIESSVNANLGGLGFAQKIFGVGSWRLQGQQYDESDCSGPRFSGLHGRYQRDGLGADLQCFAFRATTDHRFCSSER